MCRPIQRRPGFTLVEMLVALTILIVLATLAVAVIPKVQERTKALRGADQVQGWLLIAKQWAVRDRTPHGVRLVTDPADGYVRTLQYIEQPDPITGGVASVNVNSITTPPQQIMIQGQDLGGGYPDGTRVPGSLQQAVPPLVQLGDYIQLYGGTSYKILGVQSVTYDATNTPTSLLLLANLEFSAQNLPPNPTSNYLITRQPRPIAGEALLQLPDDVVIDPGLPLPNPPVTLGNPIGSRPQVAGPPFNYDILFTPTGALTGPLGDSNGKIVLWVRDFAQDSDQPGAMPLVVIFSRTGRIGGFPSNPDPVLGDPYIYVLDPRNTGL